MMKDKPLRGMMKEERGNITGYAVGCGERGRDLMQGSYGAAPPHPAPHPWVASRPAGKRPGAFPRTPFAASARKFYLMGAFFK